MAQSVVGPLAGVLACSFEEGQERHRGSYWLNRMHVDTNQRPKGTRKGRKHPLSGCIEGPTRVSKPMQGCVSQKKCPSQVQNMAQSLMKGCRKSKKELKCCSQRVEEERRTLITCMLHAELVWTRS